MISEAMKPPSIKRLQFLEESYRIHWPESFVKFLQYANGGIPKKNILPDRRYSVIERFLCITDEPKNEPNGIYDIAVVQTQLDERLSDDDEMVGAKLIPFASLFAGDFICMDFRTSDMPKIVIWDHELSEELKPHTVDLFPSFDDFLNIMGLHI